MKKNYASLAILSVTLSLSTVQAQNTSPFWSLAGNSNADNSSKLGTTTATQLNLVTNNLTRLQIFPDGRTAVGKNKTNSNSTRVLNLIDDNAVMRILRVHASFAPAVELISRTSSDGANVAYWDFYAEPSDKSFRIRDRIGGGSGLDRVTVSNVGNVGIGTTNPSYKLQVVGNAAISNGLSVGNGGVFGYNSSGAGVYGSGSSHGMYATSPGIGLYSASTGGSYGVYTTSSSIGVHAEGGTYGLHGRSSGGWGVWGHSNSGIGVGGTSGSSFGVYGNSTSNPGVSARSSSHYGVQAQSVNSYAVGAFGISGIYSQGTTGYGVWGTSNSNYGVYGRSGSDYGGYFYSTNSYGIRAATGRSDKNWAGVFDGNVYAFGVYQTSDKNLKKNIEEVSDALSIINKLKPKSYEFRNDGKLAPMHLPQGKHYGFLAQDIEEVLPSLIGEVDANISDRANDIKPPQPVAAPSENANAPTDNLTQTEIQQTETQQSSATERFNIKSVNYIELIPLLVKGMQELSKENQDLRLEVAELKQLIGKSTTGQSLTNSFGSNAMLQNIPNPVKGSTKILYSLPEGAQRSQLLITDALGRTIKIIQLTRSGVINFDTSALSAGTYNYSLIVDNKTIQTKQMIVER